MYPVLTLGHRHCWSFQSLSTKSSLEAFKQMTSQAPSIRNTYLTAKVSSAVLGRCNPCGPAAVSLLQRTADARLKRELRCYLMLSDSIALLKVWSLSLYLCYKTCRVVFAYKRNFFWQLPQKCANGDVLWKTLVQFTHNKEYSTRAGTAWGKEEIS